MYTDVKLIPVVDSIRFLNINDDEYFSNKFGGYISNSKLSLINPDQGGSPSIYKEGLSKHQKFSDSLIFGSAVHELILQPESFILVDTVNRPTAKAGLMADELFLTLDKDNISTTTEEIIKASDKIDYYKGKMDEDKITALLAKCKPYWEQRIGFEKSFTSDKTPIYLDPKSREKLNLCLSSVNDNIEIHNLLNPKGVLECPICLNEAALFIDVKSIYKGKEHILPLKAKLDNFTIDTELNSLVLNDLKTTGHWLNKFKESFVLYHYNRQMAMYSWLLKYYAFKKYNVKATSMTANMLLVSTVPDYYSGVFKVSNSEIKKGFLEMKDLLQRVAYCEITNNYEDGCLES